MEGVGADGTSAADAGGSEAVPQFRKPKSRKNARVRPSEPDEDPAPAGGSDVVRPVKVAKANPLVVGTKNPDNAGKPGMREELAHGSDRRISQYDNKAFATNEQDVDRSQDALARLWVTILFPLGPRVRPLGHWARYRIDPGTVTGKFQHVRAIRVQQRPNPHSVCTFEQ